MLRRHPRTLAWIALLSVALLLSQFLGLAHGVVHFHAKPGSEAQGEHRVADKRTHADVHTNAHTDTHDDHASHHGDESFFAWLFDAHDEGGPECRLYDALGHGDALLLPQLTIPAATLMGGVLQTTHSEFVGRRAASYDARGPPAFG